MLPVPLDITEELLDHITKYRSVYLQPSQVGFGEGLYIQLSRDVSLLMMDGLREPQ